MKRKLQFNLVPSVYSFMLRVDTSNISPLRHSVSSQLEKEIIFVLNFPAITRYQFRLYTNDKVDVFRVEMRWKLKLNGIAVSFIDKFLIC